MVVRRLNPEIFERLARVITGWRLVATIAKYWCAR